MSLGTEVATHWLDLTTYINHRWGQFQAEINVAFRDIFLASPSEDVLKNVHKYNYANIAIFSNIGHKIKAVIDFEADYYSKLSRKNKINRCALCQNHGVAFISCIDKNVFNYDFIKNLSEALKNK